jgi:hypothetical protein
MAMEESEENDGIMVMVSVANASLAVSLDDWRRQRRKTQRSD